MIVRRAILGSAPLCLSDRTNRKTPASAYSTCENGVTPQPYRIGLNPSPDPYVSHSAGTAAYWESAARHWTAAAHSAAATPPDPAAPRMLPAPALPAHAWSTYPRSSPPPSHSRLDMRVNGSHATAYAATDFHPHGGAYASCGRCSRHTVGFSTPRATSQMRATACCGSRSHHRMPPGALAVIRNPPAGWNTIARP